MFLNHWLRACETFTDRNALVFKNNVLVLERAVTNVIFKNLTEAFFSLCVTSNLSSIKKNKLGKYPFLT